MRAQMVEAKQSKILSATSEPEGPLRETDGRGVWAVLTQLDDWKGGKTWCQGAEKKSRGGEEAGL